MKKILASVLVFIMCLGFACPFAMAENGVAEGLEWHAVNNEYVVVGHYEGDAEELVIPSEIDGLPVTKIETTLICDCADNHTVKKMVIPETVTEIDTYTLSRYVVLENVEVNANNKTFASKDGILYSADMKTLIYCADSSKLSEYIVPETVT